MNNKKVSTAIVSVVTVLIMLSVCMTAYATADPSISEETYATEVVTTQPYTQETLAPTEAVTDPPTEEVTQAPTQSQTTNTQQPSTTANSKQDALPKVDVGDVLVPDTIKVPKAEVTENSLVSGVVAWLCVAVGVAVLAGVLVSQRTKQVVKPKDSRRR